MFCYNIFLLLINERYFTILNENNNFYLLNCFFQRFNTFNHQGGILYFNNNNINSNIISTIFYKCFSEKEGGSIFFLSLNGKFNLNKICSFESISYLTSHFCQINSLNLNISYLSLTNSNHLIGIRTMRFLYNYQNLNNLNSSNNFHNHITGLWIHYPLKLNLIYSTFFNSTSYDSICLCIEGGNLNIISNINLINNKSPNLGIIFVWYEGIFNFTNCIFINNSINLFQIRTGSIFILNSFIKHYFNLTFIETIYLNYQINFLNNNYFILTNTFNLIHFKTFLCNALNPLKENTFQKFKKINLILINWFHFL